MEVSSLVWIVDNEVFVTNRRHEEWTRSIDLSDWSCLMGALTACCANLRRNGQNLERSGTSSKEKFWGFNFLQVLDPPMVACWLRTRPLMPKNIFLVSDQNFEKDRRRSRRNIQIDCLSCSIPRVWSTLWAVGKSLAEVDLVCKLRWLLELVRRCFHEVRCPTWFEVETPEVTARLKLNPILKKNAVAVLRELHAVLSSE